MSCDLNRSADQRQILDAAEAMLGQAYPLARLRGGGTDDLGTLAEFGTFLLALPEEAGGAGFSLVDEALVHVALGRHLLSPRSLAAALAVRLAGQGGDAGLAEEIAGGGRDVAAAVPTAGGLLLLDPGAADLALVFGARRLDLRPIAGARPETGLGHDLRVARMEDAPEGALFTSTAPGDLALADLLVSAQCLGVAEAARDLAVDYAGVRKQFGQLIGGFQAIKHHCANMALGTERLSALLDFAALSLAGGAEDAAFQIAALRRLAPGIARRNAALCVQIHGGIGFSEEADAHRFVKQAHLLGCLGQGAPLLDLAAPLAPHASATQEDATCASH